MKSAVFALVPSSTQAESIIEKLRLLNFSKSSVSVLLPNMEDNHEFICSPEKTTAHVNAGIVFGGMVDWLVGLGALSMPGAVPLIAAGPFFPALSGMAVCGDSDELDEALANLGFNEYEAKVCARKLQEGNILIAVHTQNSREARAALEIFEQIEVRDFGVTRETADLQHTITC